MQITTYTANSAITAGNLRKRSKINLLAPFPKFPKFPNSGNQQLSLKPLYVASLATFPKFPKYFMNYVCVCKGGPNIYIETCT